MILTNCRLIPALCECFEEELADIRIEGNTIHYENGSTETVVLQDGIIRSLITHSEDGSISEMKLTPYGLLEERTVRDSADALPSFKIEITYTTLNPDDFAAQ